MRSDRRGMKNKIQESERLVRVDRRECSGPKIVYQHIVAFKMHGSCVFLLL